ncbi:magnesium/cobalt transporter CorA [Allonocardiopsis opalescens]|uniref:Magnesium transport protein CorA n=1 Tax=Allonocardiopsis opalescens TaxID=1144618 RepID=A0A2T0QFA6_9ACTN|nr:magnesium/cobalt transporter CorA [Allonocardiopsis opalescens]PRY02598.1 magnesium transporter [Allonocardiopsis opalescens]
MTECAIYRARERIDVEGDISDTLDEALLSDDRAFCWIDLHEPTETEFDLASSELNLHPLAVEDAVEAHQRPKLERYGDVLLVVLKTLSYDRANTDVRTGELMLFIGRSYVITVRHGDVDPLGQVRRRLDKDPTLIDFGPSAVLYGVIDAVVDRYVDIVDEVHAAVTDLEERVFVSTRGPVAEDIYALKREVLEIHNAVDPLVPVVSSIVTGESVRVAPEALPFFRDVADHVMLVDSRVDSLNELLPQVLAAHLAQVGVQQNDDARRITAWAAIFAMPTMIAGIYGMNFDVMPELRWAFGYPMAIFAMVAVCTVLFVMFRRSRWL